MSVMKKAPGQLEFIFLMAGIMCMTALSIDIVLPALGLIRQDLLISNANDAQYIISFVFLGVALGQMFFGPFSDVKGRKPAIYIGFVVFILGCLVSLFSENLELMLLGRILQGFGASAPRIVTVALVRDRYKGKEMARIMSLIMTIFILCPLFAPLLGQLLLTMTDWRGVFAFLAILALVACTWFSLRQEETLPVEKRVKHSFQQLFSSLKEVITHKESMAYILGLGLVFGCFIGFLSSAQQLLQVTYQLGELFPLQFAGLAFVMGVASFSNSKLVARFGLRFLVLWSLSLFSLASLLTLIVAYYFEGLPPYGLLVIYLLVALFCIGLLFGNLNALAMVPFGHIAGLAASVVGTFSTIPAVIIGILIGQAFDDSVIPLLQGFALCGCLALLLVWQVGKKEALTQQMT